MADPGAAGLRAGLLVGAGVAAVALFGLGLAEVFDVGLLLRPGERMDDRGALRLSAWACWSPTSSPRFPPAW